MREHDISGKVVLITGASSGIGEACANMFAERGCHLILLARRIDRLRAIQERLDSAYKVRVFCQQLDMRDTSAVANVLDTLPADLRDVDILVNNAGLALGTAAAHENDMQDVATMIETNVTGLIAMTRAIAPGMIARNAGHVINISSVAGSEAYGGGSVYCATKHAVAGFTGAMRHDFVGTQVRVTAISPGAVRTEFSNVRFGGDAARADAVYAGIEPLTADDVADNVLYAATRPPHVQIADIVMYATLQCSAKGLARVLPH